MGKSMYVHPEVSKEYLDELCKTTKRRPTMDYENCRMFSFVEVWNECMKDTNEILEELMFRPVTATPFEELEAYIQVEENLDSLFPEMEEDDE